jgi:hypothetical protein
MNKKPALDNTDWDTGLLPSAGRLTIGRGFPTCPAFPCGLWAK